MSFHQSSSASRGIVLQRPRPGFHSLLYYALYTLNVVLQIRKGNLLRALTVLDHPFGWIMSPAVALLCASAAWQMQPPKTPWPWQVLLLWVLGASPASQTLFALVVSNPFPSNPIQIKKPTKPPADLGREAAQMLEPLVMPMTLCRGLCLGQLRVRLG